MYYHYANYSEAVNHAANLVLTDETSKRAQRVDRLFELLYSLADSIPESWKTAARTTLERRECSIERIVRVLSRDVAEHPEFSEYFVLSSVLLLALTIKQLSAQERS